MTCLFLDASLQGPLAFETKGMGTTLLEFEDVDRGRERDEPGVCVMWMYIVLVGMSNTGLERTVLLVVCLVMSPYSLMLLRRRDARVWAGALACLISVDASDLVSDAGVWASSISSLSCEQRSSLPVQL